MKSSHGPATAANEDAFWSELERLLAGLEDDDEMVVVIDAEHGVFEVHAYDKRALDLIAEFWSTHIPHANLKTVLLVRET